MVEESVADLTQFLEQAQANITTMEAKQSPVVPERPRVFTSGMLSHVVVMDAFADVFPVQEDHLRSPNYRFIFSSSKQGTAH